MQSLSRTQFQQACEAFIRKQAETQLNHDFVPRDRQRWQWHNHPAAQHLGYLARMTSAFRRTPNPIPVSLEEDMVFVEVEDESTLAVHPNPDPATVTVQEYIVYSPTFGVPAFYFIVQDQDGTPLPLQEVVRTSLFRPEVLPECASTEPHAVTLKDSQFPLLSFGDHPVLGMPCWYFHPCETSRAVNELLGAVENLGNSKSETTDQSDLLTWLEKWFLVLGTVVDLR
ncbi:hypothetical protein M422DRAFT_238173 [Sphaerobolus stellatus SS14]|nr:hypothetical protein M422DRAFT_238173 [Sphaerobolus stellatus SS14]